MFDHDFTDIKNDSGVVLYRYHVFIDNFLYKVVRNGKKEVVNLTEKRLLIYNPTLAGINREAINNALQLAGYSLLITSETEMDDQDIYNAYHNLGYIQESFKFMKSDLDAAPEFLQKEDAIKGYFLISYPLFF